MQEGNEPKDLISAAKLRDILQAEIGNRQSEYANVMQTARRLEAEIAALMLAQDKASRLVPRSL